MRNLLVAAALFYGSLTLWMHRELRVVRSPAPTLGESLLAELRQRSVAPGLRITVAAPALEAER